MVDVTVPIFTSGPPGQTVGLKIQLASDASGAYVPVVALDSDDNITIGAVSQEGLWVVTADAGNNLNTSALALESGGNLASIVAALALVIPTITTVSYSNVAAATSDTLLLAANQSRKKGSTIANDSTAILYIKLGSGSSATSFMVAIDGKTTVPGIFSIPDGYTGAVYGTWASATGAARVTEMQ